MSRARIAGAAVAAAVAIATPFIAGWEGKKNDPYADMLANGLLTVCYGETRVEMRRYTDAECLAMLEGAVSGYAKNVLKCSPGLADRPYQLAAATSLAYNIGSAAYCRSTSARRFNTGNIRGGCDAILFWRYAGGKEVYGLKRRREAERKLCMVGLS